MSKLKYYILIFLCAVGMTACQDDLIENTSTKLDTNKPVQVELKFGIPKSMRVEVSRADNSYSTISTLRLYVFDGDRLIGEPQSFSRGTNTLTDAGTIDNEGHYYSVDATLYQGTQTVYAVANAYTENYWNDPTEALDEAAQKGKSAFLETVYDLYSGLTSSNFLPTFTSETIPLSGEGEITVTRESNPTATGIVRLQRPAAKIVFDITEESTTDENHNVTFTPQYFGVYKVAGRSYVMNSENERTSIGDEYFYNTSNDQPITRLQLGIFVPENIQESTQVCTDYDDRDEVDPKQVGASDAEKSWTNAPANATYIVIKGTYVETNGGNLVRQADVSYTVHLGDWSEGNYNDFSVLRNYIYTYHMEVKGVNKIVVEAKAEEDSDEFQDAAEGDVIEVTSGSEVFNLDAHYEQVYVEYDLTEIANQVTERFEEEDNTQQNKDERIKELIANSFILSIHTPMNLAGASDELLRPYLGEDEDGETSMKGLDWRWIEMYSQTNNGISTYTTAKRSSNTNYLLNPWEACRKMGQAVYALTQNLSEEPQVDNLQIVSSDGHYKARFTIFVDEFFYTHNLNKDPVDWADFTRIDPRTFMIATDIQVSPDGNSSYATARTYISQASILTFYNRESADNTNALGIESYNEYGIIKGFGNVDEHSRNNDENLSNGRANMILNTKDSRSTSSSYGGINFTHIGYVSSNTSGHLWTELERNEKDETAYKACLSRNRDLNGNGRIDDDEIHWYLPSRSQYLRMGIGANSLGDYQLYTGTKSAMNFTDYPIEYADEGALYYSNTPNGNTSSSSSWELYWAVEVGAYGSNSYGDGDGDNGAQIRCVRNLPSMEHVEANDDPNGDDALAGPVYNELKQLSSDNYIFDFGNRLDGTLYRATVQEDPYISHTEVDDANMLPAAFVVAKEDASEWINRYWDQDQREWIAAHWEYQFTVSRGWSGSSDNPCADYNEDESDMGRWRVPNLSELMVMSTVDTDLEIRNKVYLCSTQFSNSAVRSGFRYNETLIAAWDPNSGNQTGYVRCVRDATEDEIKEVRNGN